MKVFVCLAVCLAVATVWVSAGTEPNTLKISTEGPNENNRTCNAPIEATREGDCPEPNPLIRCIWCNDNCRSDNECPGEQKCCWQPGCGNWCKEKNGTDTSPQ